MTIKTYDGYRITELRRYATEHAIAGRSKMTGDELLAAVRAVWDLQRKSKEAALLAAGPIVPGVTILRHKSSGYTIRATSEVQMWPGQNDALFITAEYVELDGWGADRRTERAAYQNEENARRTERGEVVRHPIWQYEIVPPAAPDMTIDVRVGPDYTGGDFTQAVLAATESIEQRIERLSKGKGHCACGAPAGDPCRRTDAPTEIRPPHTGRPNLPGTEPTELDALRAEIGMLASGTDGITREGVLARLDRVLEQL